jgi:transcriptional regulator with XRE-family HTH domain
VISPLVRRKRLAEELRELREAAGLTTEQLGRKVGFHRLKVGRFEGAQGRPDPMDVMKLLDALNVEGDRWHKLVEIAKDASERGWYWRIAKDLGPRQAVYADLESGAETIREYQNAGIPGLLQTRDYAHARIAPSRFEGNVVPEDAERHVAARAARQRMLRRPGGPRYEAILEEVAIRRPAASDDVMREQLLYLADLASSDKQFTIRVLPIRIRIPDYYLPTAPFSLYTYPDSGDPTMLAVDTETEDLVRNEDTDVARYSDLYDRLSKVALSAKESVEFLKQAADNVHVE